MRRRDRLDVFHHGRARHPDPAALLAGRRDDELLKRIYPTPSIVRTRLQKLEVRSPDPRVGPTLGIRNPDGASLLRWLEDRVPFILARGIGEAFVADDVELDEVEAFLSRQLQPA